MNKAVQAALFWLRRQVWDEIIRRHLRFRRCRPAQATGQPRTSTLASAVSTTPIARPMLSSNTLTRAGSPTG